MKADLVIIDLEDVAYQPLNSVARQLVFSEAGRGIETVIVDGNVVMRERRIMTIDEQALRDELASLMPQFRRDFARITKANEPVIPLPARCQRATEEPQRRHQSLRRHMNQTALQG
jgi:5-methylthioadenosine/S-adenosylhomocysteine deaminase